MNYEFKYEHECETCGEIQVWYCLWQPAEFDVGINEGYLVSLSFDESDCKCYNEQTDSKIISGLEDKISELVYERDYEPFVPDFD